MKAASVCAIACGLLLAEIVDALRKSKLRDRTHGADTFDAADDHSEEQMQQQSRIAVTPGGPVEEHFGAMTTFALGSGPKCASQSSGQRVVSMADMHGDFTAMVKHMHLLGLLSRLPSQDPSTWRNIWGGGSTIFVQTGDILDRGPDGKAMYKFLWSLQDQAPQGQVVLLTGNHELMVLQGDIRYVTNVDFCHYTKDNCGGKPPSSVEYCENCCNHDNRQCNSGGGGCLKGNCEFLEAWDKNGEMGAEMRKRFAQGKMKLSYRINGVVFTHAGLVSSIWSKINVKTGEDPIEKLNNVTAALFSGSSGASLRSSNSIIAEGSGQNGPMWSRVCYSDWATKMGRRRGGDSYRYYIDEDEAERVGSRCGTVDKSLRQIGATRMVIGHCPQSPSSGSAGVKTSCSGAFVEADTYMSIAYAKSRKNADYNMAALEFYSGDSQQRVWVVYSGRSRCERLPDVEESPTESPTPPPRRRSSSTRRRRRRRA